MTKAIIYSVLTAFTASLVAVPVSASNDTANANPTRTKTAAMHDRMTDKVHTFQDARKRFLDARSTFQRTKKDSDREVSEDRAKEFVKKSIQHLLGRLERMKNWVEGKDRISDEDKAAIIADLDADIAWLTEKLSAVDGMSHEEVKALAKEIRDFWKDHKRRIKRISGHMHAARFSHLLDKAEHFSTRVGSKIGEMKDAGQEVGELEEMLREYNALVDEAVALWEQAKAKYEEIRSGGDAETLFKEANELLRQAHQKLKEAHMKLREIVREIKSMSRSTGDTDDDNDGTVDDPDDEN